VDAELLACAEADGDEVDVVEPPAPQPATTSIAAVIRLALTELFVGM
jgi:hypothetical protein